MRATYCHAHMVTDKQIFYVFGAFCELLKSWKNYSQQRLALSPFALEELLIKISW